MGSDTKVFSTDFIVLDAEWTVAQAQLVLQHTASDFVIVRRSQLDYLVYLFPLQIVRRRLDAFDDDTVLLHALDLHEYTATTTIRLEHVVDTSGPAVVIDQDGVISGFVVPSGQSKSPTTASSTFAAYPAIIAPVYAAVEQPFDVVVGFRNMPDPALIGGSTPLIVTDLQPTEECLLVVTGEGIRFDRSTDWLPWRMNEMRLFSATPTRTGQCIIRVDFYRQRQLIGQAERWVAVDSNDLPKAPPSRPLDFRPNDMDLLITLRRDGDVLRWTAMPRDTAFAPVIDEPSSAALTSQAAQQFAVALIEQAIHAHPTFAASGIEGIASTLTHWVPPPLWQLQADLAAKHQRMLTVLLKTDEVFVPWELVHVPSAFAVSAPAGRVPPLFWAAQTYFARWIDAVDALALPPPATTITHITAVAWEYTPGSGQAELPHAVPERTLLEEEWQATGLKATSDDIAPLFTSPAIAGHLIHFAVHGRSEPLARTHELILADQQSLTPTTLMGKRGQTPPRFTLVFLNACQVATPGTSLGQTAGFPGEVIAGGAEGFIAPLWEADDDEAFAFARTFYTSAFAGQPIGAILQAYRSTYSPSATTTRLAYVYYGHPSACLTYQRHP